MHLTSSDLQMDRTVLCVGWAVHEGVYCETSMAPSMIPRYKSQSFKKFEASRSFARIASSAAMLHNCPVLHT
jgi:hypothetical protein